MSKGLNKYVKPPCKYYERCCGCQLQRLSNEPQSLYKEDIVEKIITMDNPYEYRNKTQYSFGYGEKGKIILGMYAMNSHNIIDIEKCII